MSNQSVGIYFDGKSAVPHPCSLLLETQKGMILFETETGHQERWLILAVSFENSGNSLQLHKQSTDGVAILKITDATFAAAIQKFRKENNHINWYEKLLASGFKMHLVLALVIFALIGLTYMYAIPWVGEKSVVLIPESFDDTMSGTFISDNLLFSDVASDKSKVLNAFAKELQLNNKKKLKFIFVEEDIVNAFALPDGTIVVYSGIVNKMKNYDELVALLGHEAAHVNHRHSMKMLCRNLSGYLFISAILGDANGIMATIGDNVNSFQSLSFSREFEQEADREGFAIVIKNKVDPNGMLNLFKRLQDEGDTIIPEFFSSHPVTQQRIATTRQLIKSTPHQVEASSKLQQLFQQLKK
ncbi:MULTISPECIES: M48 family metallopeptidase [unclassified Flavobacterium]|uniref:M48 family metallopeptidase n=1 Tax=unclassified Flavobacterium TaxID=196869 RepID=UPI00131CE54B|nr:MULTISPECIES: M48 family metallopeptidase [unclassified Flavobacterium]